MKTSIFDVAHYILEQCGPMTAMKLEKLCYYSQAWSLVWDGSPLFEEAFEAWANGPVCPILFEEHRLMFTVSKEDIPGNSLDLTDDQKATVDAVIEAYDKLDAYQLSTLTHTEAPWVNARDGLPSGARSNRVITLEAMEEYYGSLVDAAQA
jgi:uncharacterized phage-associated protein